jgi:hypothetical protein
VKGEQSFSCVAAARLVLGSCTDTFAHETFDDGVRSLTSLPERRRACASDGSITWVDGTGKFAGASGQIRVMADVQPDGTVVSDYRGELCTP